MMGNECSMDITYIYIYICIYILHISYIYIIYIIYICICVYIYVCVFITLMFAQLTYRKCHLGENEHKVLLS